MEKGTDGPGNGPARRWAMLAVFLAPFYILVNYYLFRRITGWIGVWFPAFTLRRHYPVPTIVYGFFALSLLIAFFLPQGGARRVMKEIGNYWLGVLLYLLLTVVFADLLRLLLVHGLHLGAHFASPWVHRLAGCACAAAILAATVGGVWNARVIHVTP